MAMQQALNGQIPDKQQWHEPSLQNLNHQTVALILADKGIIPPREWNHNPNIKDADQYTVEQLLRQHQLPVPNAWYRNIKESELNSKQIQQAIYNEVIVIDETFRRDQQNIDGWTVAMIQARLKKVPEKRFLYTSELKNRYGQTVEDLMKRNNLKFPKQDQKQNVPVVIKQKIIPEYQKKNLPRKTIQEIESRYIYLSNVHNLLDQAIYLWNYGTEFEQYGYYDQALGKYKLACSQMYNWLKYDKVPKRKQQMIQKLNGWINHVDKLREDIKNM